MRRNNKWIYSWELSVDSGNGFEYVSTETTHKGYKYQRDQYNRHCRYPVKWVECRVLNPDWNR